MSENTVTDVDGAVYVVTWADDGLSADVTSPDGRLCLVYAATRDGHKAWFTTESGDVYASPIAAIMAVTAALRAQRAAGAPSPAQRSPAAAPQRSWRSLLADPSPAPQQRTRKDWE